MKIVLSLVRISFHSVLGLTSDIARVVGRMSEGDRIHVSETTKLLLDKLGGFKCEYRGVLDLGVSINQKSIREKLGSCKLFFYFLVS